MQRAVELHVPVYEKKQHVYRLSRFMRVGADVPNTRMLQPALAALGRAPCVVFGAGDVRHYMCFEDRALEDAKTARNMRWDFAEAVVDERSHDGEENGHTRMMPTATSLAFFDEAGRMRCLPIRDYLAEYPQAVLASQMLQQMAQIAARQVQVLQRLVGQLCFVNVLSEEVSSTERVVVGSLANIRLRRREARFGW